MVRSSSAVTIANIVIVVLIVVAVIVVTVYTGIPMPIAIATLILATQFSQSLLHYLIVKVAN